MHVILWNKTGSSVLALKSDEDQQNHCNFIVALLVVIIAVAVLCIKQAVSHYG